MDLFKKKPTVKGKIALNYIFLSDQCYYSSEYQNFALSLS